MRKTYFGGMMKRNTNESTGKLPFAFCCLMILRRSPESLEEGGGGDGPEAAIEGAGAAIEGGGAGEAILRDRDGACFSSLSLIPQL